MIDKDGHNIGGDNNGTKNNDGNENGLEKKDAAATSGMKALFEAFLTKQAKQDADPEKR